MARCAEGPARYMTECAYPSDLFMYLLSQNPVAAPTNTTFSCAALGYEFVAPDLSVRYKFSQPRFMCAPYWKHSREKTCLPSFVLAAPEVVDLSFEHRDSKLGHLSCSCFAQVGALPEMVPAWCTCDVLLGSNY